MLSSLSSHVTQLAEAVLACDVNTAVEVIKSLPGAYQSYWWALYEESPRHVIVETFLILFIIYILVFKKSYDPKEKRTVLSEKEIQKLVDEWVPEPLIEPLTEEQMEASEIDTVVEKFDGVYVEVAAQEREGGADAARLLDATSFDFLGLGGRPESKKAVVDTLTKYGCGSCGPRGFYGTLDTHYHMEADIAEFMGSEESISYSDASATLASAVAAFAKKGDLLVADEGLNDALRTGITLSRSEVRWFKHNDMADLEALLLQIQAEDEKLGRAPASRRRFIIAEGLYRNWGSLAPLPELVALKKRFWYRIILDESFSIGVLGATGRGLTEATGVERGEVDVLLGSLGNTLASVGGFCVAERELVDHQRLSGAGYCFSAAAPPFTQVAVSRALAIMQEEPKLLVRLGTAAKALRTAAAAVPMLEVLGDESSPLIHVVLAPAAGRGTTALTAEERREILTKMVAHARMESDVLMVTTRHTPGLAHTAPPSIRLAANAQFTPKQIKLIGDALADAAADVLDEEGVVLLDADTYANGSSAHGSASEAEEESEPEPAPATTPRRRRSSSRRRGSSRTSRVAAETSPVQTRSRSTRKRKPVKK